MSGKVEMKWSAIVLSLALPGLFMPCCDGRAAQPAAATASAVASPGSAAIENAAKQNKYLFILFFEKEDEPAVAMKDVFPKAMAKINDRADSITINIADSAEKSLVDKFGVRGAPMPIVLAIAPTGAPTKAFPKKLGENQLQEAFVSPCTAKCMKAIWDRRSILICVQNDKTQSNAEAMEGVKAFKADPQYTKGIEIVLLNPADKAEQSFLKDLEVDPKTTQAVTLLVTPPGAPVARFAGAVTKDQIETAVKQAQSNCGPGCKCHQ
jgi:hypothetical protein